MHIEIPLPPEKGELRPYLRQLAQVLQLFVDQSQLSQSQNKKEENALGK